MSLIMGATEVPDLGVLPCTYRAKIITIITCKITCRLIMRDGVLLHLLNLVRNWLKEQSKLVEARQNSDGKEKPESQGRELFFFFYILSLTPKIIWSAE